MNRPITYHTQKYFSLPLTTPEPQINVFRSVPFENVVRSVPFKNVVRSVHATDSPNTLFMKPPAPTKPPIAVVRSVHATDCQNTLFMQPPVTPKPSIAVVRSVHATDSPNTLFMKPPAPTKPPIAVVRSVPATDCQLTISPVRRVPATDHPNSPNTQNSSTLQTSQSKSLNVIRSLYATGLTKLYAIFVIALLSFVCLPFQTNAQEKSRKEQQLFLIARPLPDSILLRWAPANYFAWKNGNAHGYILKRYTIIRDSSLLSNPPLVVLDSNIKPMPLNDWEPLVKQNKHAALAAQALYGESFEVGLDEQVNPMRQAYLKSEEQKQRFSFALYAADVSSITARAMGLMYIDTTARANEKYLYRIIMQWPDTLNKADTASVFTGISEYEPLPGPVGFYVEYADKTALLRWNKYVHNDIYISWEIERSDDGNNYHPLEKGNMLPIEKNESAQNEYAYAIDSLPDNKTTYYYRIRGINSFGEKGPWSEPVHGQGVERIKGVPHITRYTATDKGVILFWEFPEQYESMIEGFKVMRSVHDQKGYEVLAGGLSPDTRSYTDKEPLYTGYYKVMAFRDTVASKTSYPFLVQLTDSIPPHKPNDPAGRVDTQYVAHLEWEPNTDNDLLGYIVFRSQSGNDEYTRLTDKYIPNPYFKDTLNKRNLNSRVYYMIAALDERYNQSEFSGPVAIQKPDMIPPANPVFKAAKPTKSGIELSWIQSSSSDCRSYTLHRKQVNDTAWKQVTEQQHDTKAQQLVYTDRDAQPGATVHYKLTAFDEAGNASGPVYSIKIQPLKTTHARGIRRVSRTLDMKHGLVRIKWKQPDGPVQGYKVYKKDNEYPYRLYKSVEGTENVFNDRGLKAGNTYIYRIQVEYEDGSTSGFSKEIVIKM